MNFNFEFGFPTAPNINYLFAVNESGSFAISASWNPILFPTIIQMDGFNNNIDNSKFTVNNAGLYYISCNMNIINIASLNLSLVVNDIPVPILSTGKSNQSNSHWSFDGIYKFNADDTIQVQITGSSNTANLTSGAGASLVLIQIPQLISS